MVSIEIKRGFRLGGHSRRENVTIKFIFAMCFIYRINYGKRFFFPWCNIGSLYTYCVAIYVTCGMKLLNLFIPLTLYAINSNGATTFRKNRRINDGNRVFSHFSIRCIENISYRAEQNERDEENNAVQMGWAMFLLYLVTEIFHGNVSHV